jgi:transcriptional regulator
VYLPPIFREDRLEVMHDLMRAHPFATLVSFDGDALVANHLPLMIDQGASERGTLKGHVAKANPLWKTLDPSVEVLAVFQGPHHYISPSWYPSKKQHGKVVPTWNYAVVHAYGPVSVVVDPDRLLAHVKALTSRQEAGREHPWAVADAPADYVESQLKRIVGFEIPITRIEGKWKVSQNRSEADRDGVVEGLRAEESPSSAQVADLIPR